MGEDIAFEVANGAPESIASLKGGVEAFGIQIGGFLLAWAGKRLLVVGRKVLHPEQFTQRIENHVISPLCNKPNIAVVCDKFLRCTKLLMFGSFSEAGGLPLVRTR